jgi:hypothetical protein
MAKKSSRQAEPTLMPLPDGLGLTVGPSRPMTSSVAYGPTRWGTPAPGSQRSLVATVPLSNAPRLP